MTVMDLAIDTVELLADQVTSNKPTNTNKEESKDPQVLKTYYVVSNFLLQIPLSQVIDCNKSLHKNLTSGHNDG